MRTATPNSTIGDEMVHFLGRVCFALIHETGSDFEGFNSKEAWFYKGMKGSPHVIMDLFYNKRLFRAIIDWPDRNLKGEASMPIHKVFGMTSGQLAKELQRRLRA